MVALTVRWPRSAGEVSASVTLPPRLTLAGLVGATRAALPGLGKVKEGRGISGGAKKKKKQLRRARHAERRGRRAPPNPTPHSHAPSH